MSGDLRLAELLAPLSLVTDLGMGNTPEEAMRSCLLGTALARAMDLPDDQVAHVYWTTLLRHIGCTASAHEEAMHVGGDEMAVRPVASRTDFRSTRETLALAAATLRAVPMARRPGVLISSFGPWGNEALRATCEVGAAMADRLEMAPEVRAGLSDVFERWDGKGVPRRLAGDRIAPAARFAQVATSGVAFAQIGGVELAEEVVRHRSGRMLDPDICAAFLARGRELLTATGEDDVLPATVEAEPAPARRVREGGLDACARAFADMIDLKTPFTHGHSAGVAELAEAAARVAGLPEGDAVALRRAGLFHDLGRVAVPDGVWEKPGRLRPSELEAVRLHAYHAERVLSRSPILEALAPIAGMHHERLDGSGYHRQASGAAIPMAARILGAADAYQAMTQPRPHRDALPAEAAAAELEREARGATMDREAVRAVLEAAGHVASRHLHKAPAGLSEREVEVLRLVAEGLSNREIAKRLFISPRTAESHVQHIYAKIGMSTRAGAAMFAMRHGMLA
jgi:HD-GYP domain-containing protein (c-di-GMP phosphodiesterase class II)